MPIFCSRRFPIQPSLPNKISTGSISAHGSIEPREKLSKHSFKICSPIPYQMRIFFCISFWWRWFLKSDFFFFTVSLFCFAMPRKTECSLKILHSFIQRSINSFQLRVNKLIMRMFGRFNISITVCTKYIFFSNLRNKMVSWEHADNERFLSMVLL